MALEVLHDRVEGTPLDLHVLVLAALARSEAISYGCIGRSMTVDRMASASMLPTGLRLATFDTSPHSSPITRVRV
jgi:hypothetical protein